MVYFSGRILIPCLSHQQVILVEKTVLTNSSDVFGPSAREASRVKLLGALACSELIGRIFLFGCPVLGSHGVTGHKSEPRISRQFGQLRSEMALDLGK